MHRRGGARSLWRTTGASVLLLVTSVIPLSGCGGQSLPKPVPVKGTVIFRGKPLANARVSFYGPKAPLPATGDTNENGEFVLTMYKEGDGAIVGENKVTVAALPKAGGDTMMPPDPTQISSGGGNPGTTAKVAKGAPDVIPKVYADLANTTLVWTVKPEGETAAKLELK